jgi:DNA polymerase-3 subunit beta
MELVVRKNDLLRELQLFQGIVERKNTIPILANVLMDAQGEEVRFLATDLEVGLRSKCTASVTKGGSVTLPAKKLYEIVKSLPETDIRISEEKGGVKVAADLVDSRMQTLPREDFPTLPEGPLKRARCCRAQLFGNQHQHTVANRRRYAVFSQRALFVLRGDSMSLVATDGHRLALVTAPRNGKIRKDADEDRPILKKTPGRVRLSARRGDGDIRYERGENHLFFEVGRLLISRMIDGQFQL